MLRVLVVGRDCLVYYVVATRFGGSSGFLAIAEPESVREACQRAGANRLEERALIVRGTVISCTGPILNPCGIKGYSEFPPGEGVNQS